MRSGTIIFLHFYAWTVVDQKFFFPSTALLFIFFKKYTLSRAFPCMPDCNVNFLPLIQEILKIFYIKKSLCLIACVFFKKQTLFSVWSLTKFPY